MWSNVLTNTPPEATPTNTISTEPMAGGDTESVDTASTTGSVNSLSYTTTTTSSLNLVSSDELEQTQEISSASKTEKHRVSRDDDNSPLHP